MSEAVATVDGASSEIECRHHWLIESPRGPTSRGICKLCGAEKEFRNSAGDMLWEDNPLSELSHGRWGTSRVIPSPLEERQGDEPARVGAEDSSPTV